MDGTAKSPAGELGVPEESAGAASEYSERSQDAMMELMLPLPILQFQALEEYAVSVGISTEQLVRRVIHNMLRAEMSIVARECPLDWSRMNEKNSDRP